MNLQQIINQAMKVLKANSPELFTGIAVAGVATTAYLAARAGFQSAQLLQGVETLPNDRKERVKELVQHTWRLYVPAGVTGAITIGCIVGAKKTSGQRTAAALAAYSLTEKAFSEYKEKVVEQIGANKEQKVRDELAQDKVTRYPTTSREVIIVGGGHVLCCELYTNRYFRSDMETLRKAQNEINYKINNTLYVDLNEFYELIGLPHTSRSGGMGWNSDKLLELQFSTVLAEGDEPCLAFEYNYLKPL